jgi:hypothetical protein
MAITQALCTSFKLQLLNGGVDFSSDTNKVYKIALYTSSADLDATTTAYSTTNESVGSGYTAGGNALTGIATTDSGTTAFVDFSDVTWENASLTARGALIYEVTSGNPAVAVLNFGEDKTSTTGNFVVQFPAATAANAIIRVI